MYQVSAVHSDECTVKHNTHTAQAQPTGGRENGIWKTHLWIRVNCYNKITKIVQFKYSH